LNEFGKGDLVTGKVGDHLGEALSVAMPSVDDAINKMLALATP
jgi:hypothetical protein